MSEISLSIFHKNILSKKNQAVLPDFLNKDNLVTFEYKLYKHQFQDKALRMLLALVEY